MAVFLKHKDKNKFIKDVVWVDGKVSFTDDTRDAKHYENDWFANAEKDQLQHYCELKYEDGGLAEDYTDIIPYLVVYYT